MRCCSYHAFIIIRHRHVCLPSQNAIVDKAVYCFFFIPRCLLQVADSVNNCVYFFIKVFAEFLVETFLHFGFGMADSADKFILHTQDSAHQLVGFSFIGSGTYKLFTKHSMNSSPAI